MIDKNFIDIRKYLKVKGRKKLGKVIQLEEDTYKD
jgi:hypothetical protein